LHNYFTNWRISLSAPTKLVPGLETSVSVSTFWRQIEKKLSRNHQLIGIGQIQGEQRVFVDM
jgi:hypothetical protein